MSNDFINNLREFNRKERYYVVKAATEGGFTLSAPFMKTLNEKLPDSCKIGDREGAFVAMDYHLDWIYASLILSEGKNEMPFQRKKEEIGGTQEDIDLVIAYPDSHDRNKSHLILIEAKGDTSWTNKQAQSKAKRLKAIFGDKERRFDHVFPYFMIWSPNETKLKTEGFPKWALTDNKEFRYYIKLTNMKNKEAILKKVVRCDNDEKMTASKNGNFWKVV